MKRREKRRGDAQTRRRREKLFYLRVSSRVSSFICLILMASPPAFARLGDRLADAKKTDFFTFFNLGETGRSEGLQEGRTVVTFKPRAGDFRELVMVNVTVDPQDRIVAMGLLLNRSFVDHKTNGIFARDIARSMLRAAVTVADEAAISDLINEIGYPQDKTGQQVVRTEPVPKLPAQATPGYEAYLGRRKLYEQKLSGSSLLLHNIKINAVDLLLISVRAAEGHG